MKKYEFLYKLQQGRASLPTPERMEQCAFYEELINDMMEDGYSEDEAAAKLGDPAALAEEILRGEPGAAPSEEPRPFKGWRDMLADFLQAGKETLHRTIRQSERFETVIPDGGVDSLSVAWPGDVTVCAGDRDGILIAEFRDGNEPPFYSEIRDGTLYISHTAPGQSCFGHKDMEITLPRPLAETLGSFVVTGGGGDVELRGLGAERMEIRTASGDVTAKGVRADTAVIVTASGDLELELDAGQAELRTVSGDLNARGSADARLDAGTTSGDVELAMDARELTLRSVSGDVHYAGNADRVRFSAVSGDGELTLYRCPSRLVGDTVSGDMDIRLPRETRCCVSFRTKTGDLHSRGVDVFRAENAAFELKTVSGDVTISD